MTLVRITALAILVGCAAGLVVWFGWGLVARLFAAPRASAAPETPRPDESGAERA